jgi:hypothetical protein
MLPAFAVMLPVLLLACGLCVDLAMLELCQIRMQAAADDAAYAVAFEVEHNHSTSYWQGIGKQETATYGFTDGSNNVSVTIFKTPTSGAYAGRTDAMEVDISQSVKTIFMGAFNGGYSTVTAQAISLVTPCVYLLGAGKLASATYQSITGATNAYGICPMAVNKLMDVESPSHADLEAVNIYGGGTLTGSGEVSPSPYYNTTSLTDPLAAMAAPSFGSCSYTSFGRSGTTSTLSPGTYCKGLNLTNATVTLNPGLYVITGGADWESSTVTGSGVTLFFTQGGGASYGQFVVNNSTLSLSAPTSASNGSIAAITVFADRNWVATQAQDFRISYSTMTGDGIWYLPAAGLYLWNAGTITGPKYFGLVADNYYQEGTNFNPRGDYSYVTTGNPFRTQQALVQ